MADRPPDDLHVTVAWGDLFSEFRPCSVGYKPPDGLAVFGGFLAVIGAGMSGWLGLFPLVMIWILAGQLAVFYGLVQARRHRRDQSTRLLLKLTPDRIELRWKHDGLVRREHRVALADITAVDVVTQGDEPEIWFKLDTGASEVLPMRGALIASAEWLQARIEERRQQAWARRGDAEDVPAAIRELVERR